MKKADAVEKFLSGQPLQVVGFVHFKKEVITYRDPATKQNATFNKLEFSVVGPDGVAFVQPDTRKIPGFDMEKFQCPYKPGQRLVVHVTKREVNKGVTVIAGTLEPLED